VFGKPSGRLREFPKDSRRNLEEIPKTTRPESGRRFYPEWRPNCPKILGKKIPVYGTEL
jgi:hypothetical protein